MAYDVYVWQKRDGEREFEYVGRGAEVRKRAVEHLWKHKECNDCPKFYSELRKGLEG